MIQFYQEDHEKVKNIYHHRWNNVSFIADWFIGWNVTKTAYIALPKSWLFSAKSWLSAEKVPFQFPYLSLRIRSLAAKQIFKDDVNGFSCTSDICFWAYFDDIFRVLLSKQTLVTLHGNSSHLFSSRILRILPIRQGSASCKEYYKLFYWFWTDQRLLQLWGHNVHRTYRLRDSKYGDASYAHECVMCIFLMYDDEHVNSNIEIHVSRTLYRWWTL